MTWQTLRGIVEELDVSEYVDLHSETFPRFSEAWEGLKWLLARNPELKGSALRRTEAGQLFRAYVLAGDPLGGTPDIWVVYTYNESEVVVVSVAAKLAVVESDED